MDGSGDTQGIVTEFKGRRGPAWRRAVDVAIEAWRRRAAARAVSRSHRPLPDIKLSRSKVDVMLEARVAVRAGVRLEDFLRQRLAKYAARLPIALEELPVVVDIEGGEPTVRGRAPARPAVPATYGAAYPTPAQPQQADPAAQWLKALVEREGPFAAQRIHEAEAEVAALEARAVDVRARAEKLARELADDLASGKVPAPPRIDATPEQLGRPPVPAPAPIGALHVFVAALVAAEAWFFSTPMLEAQGLAHADVLRAIEATPLPVGMSLVFSIGAAAAVFAFAAVALSRAADVLASADARRRRVLLAGAGLVAALLSGAVAAAATSAGRAAQLSLLVVVPFAGGILLRIAARLHAARRAALEAALAWDRALARDVAERARRSEIVEEARAELQGAELDLADARRRLHTLERRAIDTERAATDRSRAEQRRLERLAESLAAALEMDRYVFVRLASEAAHDALARPTSIRRLDPAVAPERVGLAR